MKSVLQRFKVGNLMARQFVGFSHSFSYYLRVNLEIDGVDG